MNDVILLAMLNAAAEGDGIAVGDLLELAGDEGSAETMLADEDDAPANQ